MNNQVPELWRICSTTSINYFLDKNNTQFKMEDTGRGVNSGNEKCDYLATKDGWMKFSLEKRLEANILTEEEYKYAFECYETIRNNLSVEEWTKINYSKDIYLIHQNFEIPILNNNINKKKLTPFQTKLHNCILDLQKTTKGLITYKTLTEYYKKIYNTNHKELCISTGIKKLYQLYYKHDGLPRNF